jgi:uncharacterized damage-inducible protein DinB
MPHDDPRIALLVSVLEQAFDKKSWHGTTLRGSLRGVSAGDALWRPAKGRHNVWELAVHAAYWKYTVRRQIQGEKRGSFPRQPSNWARVPDAADEKAWKADVALLEAEHAALVDAVRALPPKRLDERSPKGTWTLKDLIQGVAAHDLYHCGQIQLVKRLRGR